MYSVTVSFIIMLIIGCYGEEEGPLVQTLLGEARGYYKISHGGRQFSAFEGLPYAKPPVGDRRFEEPKPADPWLGTWNATYPTTCAQTTLFQPNVTSGDEDCLHINVYVPKKTPNPEDKLDVIVHIHGGAYLYASGHAYARPDIIMDRDVIFVTFNYRLGILGFLSTEDDVVPGNNGLKDQTLALKWVQQNIARFGGNPNSVTITGLSAGGSSVHLHYFSELSRGLFHRGISNSGLALNPFSIQEEPLMRAKKLAATVGCPTCCTRKMVDCLKQRTSKQLLDKLQEFFVFGFMPCVPFGPVVEKGGNKPFIKEDPYLLLLKGEVTDVPWIASITSHEGLFPINYFINNLDVIEENWDEWAPSFLEYNYTAPKSSWKSIAQTIKKQYLGDGKISEENLPQVVQIFSDRLFAGDADTAVRMQANANKSPTYFYIFSFLGDNNPTKMVSHGNDAKYFFTNVFVPQPLTENELKMSEILNDMLVEFAKTGKAVIKGVDWKPSGSDKLTYININGYEDGDITLDTTQELAHGKFLQSLQFAEGKNLISKREEL